MISLPSTFKGPVFKYLSEEIYPAGDYDRRSSFGFIASKPYPHPGKAWQMLIYDEEIVVETWPKTHETFLSVKYGVQ